jgi:hypothetical protein
MKYIPNVPLASEAAQIVFLRASNQRAAAKPSPPPPAPLKICATTAHEESKRDSEMAVDLQQYLQVGDWLDHHPNPFFQTRSSLDWFVRHHREELVERGALIPRAGRNGSLIHQERFPEAVVDIHRREAQERSRAK